MKIIRHIITIGATVLLSCTLAQATPVTFTFDVTGGATTTTSDKGGEGAYSDVTFSDSGSQVKVRAGISTQNLNSRNSFSSFNGRRVYWDLSGGPAGLGNVATGNTSGDNFNANVGNANKDEILFFDFLSDFTLDSIFFNGEHRDLLSNSNKPRFHLFVSDDPFGTGIYTSTSLGAASEVANRNSLTYNVTSQYFALAITGGTGAKGYVEALSGSNPVPEPTTMLLFGTGLIGLAGVARRKKK